MIHIEDIVTQPVEIETELKMLLKTKASLIFFDIGACTGEDSIRYKMLFPHARVFAFEPLPKNVQIMKSHFNMFKMEDIEIVEKALSDKEEITEFHVSSGNPNINLREEEFTTLYPKEWNKSSSLLSPGTKLKEIYPWLNFENVISVNTQTVDGFCAEKRISSIDFIHMDVQGAEMNVLKGAEKTLPNISLIWLEVENVELYESQPLGDEIHAFLISKGFKKIKDTARNKVDGDRLYLNSLRFKLLYPHLIKVYQFRDKIFRRLSHIFR